MALLILTPTRNPHIWANRLRLADPALDCRIWPDQIGARTDITFALVWDHPHGALQDFPNLRAVSSLGAGVDHLLNDPRLPNVPIVRVVDADLSRSMAEYILATVLNQHRQFDRYRADQRAQRWKPRGLRLPEDLHIGIMGLGALGQPAARRLADHGFRVSGWSQTRKTLEQITCFAGAEERKDFLAALEVLVCLLPLTPETEDLLNADLFADLPQGASLINVGRGAHLVEEDLLQALNDGHLSHATLDVFRQEPLPPDHPFWAHPQITITPHISSLTNPVSVAQQIVENYHRSRLGQPLCHEVNRVRGY